MKVHTQAFKDNVCLFGRELDSKITYTLNNEDIELGTEELNSVSPHYEGGILKSVMRQLDIDSNVDIPLETILNYQFGVKIGEDVETGSNVYEYVDFGNYIVYKSEKQEDTNSYKITCYDKMLYSMKDYENMNITYPITIRNYINTICNYLGLTFKNINDTFANYNKQINAELYLDSEGNSLGYTFRDVLDELAQVTASTICINENDNELEIRYINETNDIINEEYLKDINVNLGEQYGPVNTIVLSRSGKDKIYKSYPKDLPDENKIAIEISDNQIMNFNDRDTYLSDILSRLKGLQYYLNDFVSTGITYFNLCDRYRVQIGEELYSCVMFNDEIEVTQGLKENIYTDMPEEAKTDYTKADKTDRRINQTYSIVDKQNGIIENVVTNVTEQSNKISQITQTVDELNSKIQDIADITISGESNFATFTLENINESEPIQIKVKPISDNISYLYPSSGLYPSNNLYPKVRIIRFHNNTTNQNVDYVLPDNLLIYDSTHYDEFYLDYDSQTCQVTKRCKYNADGSVSLLDTERVDDYPYPSILLEDGDYTLTLLGYEYGYLFVRLMAKNIYTSQFYTKAETNSKINQKANEITTGVDLKLSNYSTTTEVNTSINQKITDNNNAYVDIEVAKKVNNTDYTKAQIVAKINDNTSQAQISADVIDLNANDILNIISGNELNLTSKNIAIKSTNFNVDKNGNTTCKNLNATGGEIGTWKINNQGLVSTGGYFIKNITLTSQGQTFKMGLTNIYTMSDIIICRMILLGIYDIGPSGTAEFKHYDVNGDGRIDSGDLLLIRKMMGQ